MDLSNEAPSVGRLLQNCTWNDSYSKVVSKGIESNLI